MGTFSLLSMVTLACCGSISSASVAMTMEGGGWRAQSTDTGLISGLLAYLAKQNNMSSPTLAGTGLLDRFDHFSTNSGSSWFFSSLAYSASYRTLVENMAASPNTAAAQFNVSWTTPWLKATHVDPKRFNVLGKIARNILTKILGKGDEDSLFVLQYFLATNFTWNAFTDVLLSVSSISPNVRLGSAVNSWANDKVWLVAHSVLLPTGNKIARLYQTVIDVPEASYVAESSDKIPLVLPAKFSIRMGSGKSSAAPHDYISPTAVPGSVDLDFKAVVVPIIDTPHAESKPLDGRDFCNGVLTVGAGELPVTGVASASSAAAGIAPVLGIMADEGLALVDADLTPWVSNTAAGETFKVANNLVWGLKDAGGITQKSVDDLAASQVHGVIDGGYTDGTGIAHAVAAGADELVVILNSNASNDPFYVELLFKDGPYPIDPGSSRDIYPVFESPVASTVRSAFKGFHKLALPHSQYLKIFAVGTITATTAANTYFGIKGGRSITMHIVNVGADLSIGEGVNFDNYNSLTQEIIQALIADENSALLQGSLVPMVMGSTSSAALMI